MASGYMNALYNDCNVKNMVYNNYFDRKDVK